MRPPDTAPRLGRPEGQSFQQVVDEPGVTFGARNKMSVGCTHRVASLAAGLIALAAHAELTGGPGVTVTSSTGFVPVTWSEPTNGYGWGGTGRDRGDAWVPFAGWVDFGLLGGQRVTIEWDLSSQEPHQWLSWRVSRLGNDASPITGMEWDGTAWRALGSALLPAGPTGNGVVQLGADGGRGEYRLAFRGVSIAPESGGIGAIAFAVPSPASLTLIGAAAALARRRRG